LLSQIIHRWIVHYLLNDGQRCRPFFNGWSNGVGFVVIIIMMIIENVIAASFFFNTRVVIIFFTILTIQSWDTSESGHIRGIMQSSRINR
jgi:hypothetical protein